MDPIVVGVMFLLGAFVGGALLVQLGWRRPGQPAAAAPVCACDHGINFHDPETGRCHATRPGDDLDVYDGGGRKLGSRTEQIQCECRRYVGPEIMPSAWGAPLADPDLRVGQRLNPGGAASVPPPATTVPPPPPPPSTGRGRGER